jgi:metal-sulfur cluster biosynthetic enzyme
VYAAGDVAKAVADLRRSSPGVSEADLVVSGGWVADGEEITRVRRHAHGKADWITTHTTAIEVELTRRPGRDELIAALRDGVIDPDLGVNVVDLGFVRDAAITDGTASVVMTLTSPACPLTKVIEDQARTAVVGPLARELRIEWTWSPGWSPADITAEGREQLSAVGFTFR